MEFGSYITYRIWQWIQSWLHTPTYTTVNVRSHGTFRLLTYAEQEKYDLDFLSLSFSLRSFSSLWWTTPIKLSATAKAATFFLRQWIYVCEL